MEKCSLARFLKLGVRISFIQHQQTPGPCTAPPKLNNSHFQEMVSLISTTQNEVAKGAMDAWATTLQAESMPHGKGDACCVLFDF